MAQRWPAPNVKPKLSQEEFDDAVKTNIETFSMEPEEAVKSAVEEFQLQGYDLSCVVQTTEGGSALNKHPIQAGTTAVLNAGVDVDSLSAALSSLQQSLDAAQESGQQDVQQASAVAIQAGSLKAVLEALNNLLENGQPESKIVQAGLCVARSLMAPSLDIRDSFDDVGGPALIMKMHTKYSDDLDLQAELARCAECACFREEQNKEHVMESNYVISLLTKLAAHASPTASNGNGPCGRITSTSEPFIAAACGVLRAVCTADDDRPPGSKAFANARLLAKQHQALRVLLGVLHQLPEEEPSASTVSSVLATVKQLAANEEICKDFSDEGGVTTILSLISSKHSSNKEVVRCGLGALRQLSHSDVTKKLLAAKGAAPALIKLTAAYPGDAEIIEPALGVVANMTLRQPEIVTQCEQEGAVDWVLGSMRDMPASSIVQRQAAILTRNMVVRNTELRPTFLEKGAEALLRAAKKAFPKNCTDVGSAALRDLGLDNYNA